MDIKTLCDFCGSPVIRREQAASRNVRRHFCNMDCKAAFQRMAKPVTKEWLEEKYLVEGLDSVQIGRMVSRDQKSVWNWLKDFGIPTRPRGSYVSRLHNTGKPNPFLGRHHTAETKMRLREIALADGRVPFDPAVGSYMKGRKGENTPNWKGGLTPQRQSLYASTEWCDAVKAVWQRAGAKCERCRKHHNTTTSRGTFHIHHIISFAVREFRAEPSNLALLCAVCHRFVHGAANVNKEWIKEL